MAPDAKTLIAFASATRRFQNMRKRMLGASSFAERRPRSRQEKIEWWEGSRKQYDDAYQRTLFELARLRDGRPPRPNQGRPVRRASEIARSLLVRVESPLGDARDAVASRTADRPEATPESGAWFSARQTAQRTGTQSADLRRTSLGDHPTHQSMHRDVRGRHWFSQNYVDGVLRQRDLNKWSLPRHRREQSSWQ